MTNIQKMKWGKMILQVAKLIYNALDEVWEFDKWITLPTPVLDSFTLTTEAGEKLEAKVEGGELVASRLSVSKYNFEFEIFLGDNAKPIEDVNGVIPDEYAIRVIPEDATLPGFMMGRCSVSAQETFTSKDGHKVKYNFEALKPETGQLLEPYTAPAA
jgi:hypothetical protein